MDSHETAPKKTETKPSGREGTCQICGKTGAVVYDPEKAPPNRLCFRCAAEYGLQEPDDR